MQVFTHTPLDLERNQIRLIRINQGQPNAPVVECEIALFDRAQCPKYDALSYVWGPDAATNEIRLNGRAFYVRDNLHAFLKQAQAGGMASARSGLPLYTPGYLWIDQICIDQNTIAEKSQQVQRMSKTFNGAQQVITWLGKASEDSNDAMEFIPKVVDHALDSGFRLEDAEKAAELEGWLDARNESVRKMTNLLSRPYWTRLWIVQEFMLPEHLILACGNLFVNWSDLGFIRLCNLDWQIFGLANNFVFRRKDLHWPDTRDVLKVQDRLPPPNLGDCLAYFENEGCFVSHDKVYALLALANVEDKIIVDYRKPTNMIYWEVMRVLADMEFPCYQTSYLNLARAMGVTGREEGAKDERALVAFDRLFATHGRKVAPEVVFASSD
jgi:hypothetical protein